MKRIFLLVGAAFLATIACGSLRIPTVPATQTTQVLAWTPTQTPTAHIYIPPTSKPSSSPSPTKQRSATPKSTATAISTAVSRFRDSDGGIKISYFPPRGWTQTNSQLSNFAAWQGPLQSPGVHCLLNFVGIGSGLGAAFTTALLEEAVLARYPDLQIVSQEPFITDAGVDAYQAAFTFTDAGTPIRGRMFVFSHSGGTVYAIYTRYAEENSEQDAIVIASMQSFQFDR